MELEAEQLAVAAFAPAEFETSRLQIKEQLRQLERRQAIRVIGALGGTDLGEK